MAEPAKRGPGRPRSAAKDAPTPAYRPAHEKPRDARQEPCPECFPGGWDALGEDAYTAGCAHGVYRKEA
jgi:hypothetical protein